MNHNQLFIIIISLLLSGCMVEPSFTEPQPIGKSDLDKFKKKFQGDYLCLNDSSILTISESTIVQEWRIEFSVSQIEVDTTEGFELKDGLLYSEIFESPIRVEQKSDSVFGTYQYDRTVFDTSDSSLLRYYKGRHFLNIMRNEDDWRVKVLELKNGGELNISKIAGAEHIESLAELTNVETETNEQGSVSSYQMSPSRKELRELLKNSKFNEGNRFVKLKKQ